MGKDERNTYTIKEDEHLGEVKIADDVVAIIAGLAAMDVEGVSSVSGNTSRENLGKHGMKTFVKGVKVDVLEGIVTVSMKLTLKYGYSIENDVIKNKGVNIVWLFTILENTDSNKNENIIII